MGDGINSIAIQDGIVAAAIEGEAADDLGTIVFFDIEGNVLNQVNVGALPDMVTFTPDGSKVLVANEGEPEYITVSPDGDRAFVALQENNAIAVVDLETGEVSDIQPLGLKDYSRGLPEVTNYAWDLSSEVLSTTLVRRKILLGGMSGLYYEGTTDDGLLRFIATPDRGPNGDRLRRTQYY